MPKKRGISMSVSQEKNRELAEAELTALYDELIEIEDSGKYTKEEFKQIKREYALKMDDIREKYGFPRIEG